MDSAVLIGLVAVPIGLIYLFRSSPALAFMSLTAGAVLQMYVSNDLAKKVDQLVPQFSNNNQFLSIWLIAIPLLFSIMLTRKSVPQGSGFIIHLIPALCTGAMFALLIVPFLVQYAYIGMTSSGIWTVLRNAQAAIVGVGVMTSLPLIWFNKHGKKHKREKSRK